MNTPPNHLNYLKKLENNELITLFCNNDFRAFDVLIGRHLEKLKYYLHNRLHNPFEEDELMQAVLETAFDMLQKRKYREENRFEHWLMGIARNCLHGYYREKNARNGLMEESIALEELPADAETEEDIAERMISTMLTVLPKPVRKIVALHGMMGVKHEEIGQQLGIKPENVRQIYHRGLARLKQVFQKDRTMTIIRND